jgi:hypothetical protein
MVDLVIKQAVLVFDNTGTPTKIIVDGRTYTSFPSSSYGSPYADSSLRTGSATLSVQIEIQAGDFSKGGTLPAYTAFHHANGARKAIPSHS